MSWQVEYTAKARKQMKKLPEPVADTVLALVIDIEDGGPVRGDWPNFSKLNQPNFHCHLKKGRPTYVACWRVIDKKKKLIEVYYVGTHEKAPY
jgi:mRNA-degrading endonuclease RelE of RelBE toxin-antitoxin system